MKSDADPLWFTQVVTTDPEDTEIVALGRYLTGILSGTPSFTSLPDSKTYQELYMVHRCSSVDLLPKEIVD